MFGLVGGGAAVAVERVGDPPHRGAQLGWRGDAGVVDQLALDPVQHCCAFGGGGVGDLLDVRPRHVSGGERAGELGQGVELAGHVDGSAGVPGRHATRVPQRGRGGEVVVDLPVAGSGVLADRADAEELDPVREPAHACDIDRRLVGGDLVDHTLELGQHIVGQHIIGQHVEHTPIITSG